MAHWENVAVPPDFRGDTRRERTGGSYRRYHPDLLCGTSNVLSPQLTEYAADVTGALARVGERLRANPLPILYATSIRSEAIASSWIEHIRETPRAIAVAQIQDSAAGRTADQVVRNVTAMRDAIELLGDRDWEHDHIWQIHQDLVPHEPAGYRTGQVWIGGTTPLTAQYAGPPHEGVHGLMQDLLDYTNTSGDLAIVKAAIVHAQFETIHPFGDGNGRTGRALVHGILKRSGLVDGGVVPLSAALRRDVGGYIAALTAYRYDGDARADALEIYVARFLEYVKEAAASAQSFIDAATRIHRRWQASAAGARRDSALLRAIDTVIEYPVVSAPFLAEHLSVSAVTANKIIKQLVHVKILKPATGKYRKASLFQADEVLRLLEFGADQAVLDPSDTSSVANTLIHRCGAPTASGECGNKVANPGDRCWRHR